MSCWNGKVGEGGLNCVSGNNSLSEESDGTLYPRLVFFFEGDGGLEWDEAKPAEDGEDSCSSSRVSSSGGSSPNLPGGPSDGRDQRDGWTVGGVATIGGVG